MNAPSNPSLRRRAIVARGLLIAAATAIAPSAAMAGRGFRGPSSTDPTFIKPCAVPPADLTWFTAVPGEEMSIHVPSELVRGQFTVLESIAAPGAATPPHIHKSADECFFIQEGRLHFVCDGIEFDAEAGSTVVVPRGSAHSWINQTKSPVRSLVSFTPGGIEGMFPQMADVFPDGIEALAARYDTFLVK